MVQAARSIDFLGGEGRAKNLRPRRGHGLQPQTMRPQKGAIDIKKNQHRLGHCRAYLGGGIFKIGCDLHI